jgi:hypothetical protein
MALPIATVARPIWVGSARSHGGVGISPRAGVDDGFGRRFSLFHKTKGTAGVPFIVLARVGPVPLVRDGLLFRDGDIWCFFWGLGFRDGAA